MSTTEVPTGESSDVRNLAAQLKERATTLISGFSRGQRTTLAVAGAAVVVLVLAVAWVGSDTTYTPLYTGMDPADAGAVTTKLKEMGVDYRLTAGGTTIEVPEGDVYQIRADLASTDLPSASREGYGILDDQGLTTSEFGQRVGFQRAMEGELAKTIEALDGVRAAVVHLAIPKDEVFALDKASASASVMVKTDRTLRAEQVRAIRNLVASSIESLEPEAVTIADSTGKVLAAPGQGEMAGGSGGSDDVVGEYQRRLAAEIESTLSASIGAGKVKATVAADLNLDQITSTSETYEAPPLPEGQTEPLPLEESLKRETYGSSAGGTQGQLGAADPGTPTGGAAGTYSLEESQKRNAVNKTVETIIRQPGSVRRLSVAVVVDEAAVPAAQVAAITEVVSKAAGIDEARGDEVVVTRMPFDASVQEEMKETLENRVAENEGSSILLLAGLGVVVLAIVIATFVVLRRRKRQLAELTELAEKAEQLTWETPPPTEATPIVTATYDGGQETASSLSARRDDRREALGELIDNQPDEVAQLLRSWLADRRTVRR